MIYKLKYIPILSSMEEAINTWLEVGGDNCKGLAPITPYYKF